MQAQTFRLPHSGLVVPHTGYTVTAYKEIPTPDGVAFTATLRLNRTIIGTIDNSGMGGPDTFTPNTTDGYRHLVAALDDFATRCTDIRGETPDVEFLLGDLVTEYQTTRDIARAAKRGNVLLRMMQDHEGTDGPMGWASEGAITEMSPAMAADRERLRTSLLSHQELAPHDLAWWQLWTADNGRWNDVTSRPVHLPTDRY